MSAPQDQTRVHPRRRPLKSPPPLFSASSSGGQNVSPSQSSRKIHLRKVETFHSPTSPPSEDSDPVLSFRSLPRRSPTCTRTLEAIAEGEQRMAEILASLSLDSAPTNSNDSPPVDDHRSVSAQRRSSSTMDASAPFLKNTAKFNLAPPAGSPPKAEDNDSGLGSSIKSSQNTPSSKTKVKSGQLSCANESQSAITGSISAVQSGNPERRQLGIGACKQIERYVLVPILKEERLKPFHPLVQSIPQRIVDKQISSLRDLEKTLLWLAPSHSPSRRSYLGFCEVTIQCLHTSTSYLNDRDLRLPTDRPYTNGYFLDLIEQVRRYAAMINQSRDQIECTRQSGKSIPKSVFPIRARVSLEGGLSKTGRPAEIVAHKDGKPISMRTGEPYTKDATPAFKRSLSINSVDDGAERSMARRKKNAPPMDINKKCKDCDKVFKRPCDLTKHEKTHSRPWKCSVSSCKYHQIGWPTEKERDRHVNDKHSNSPALFTCTFAPCAYQSKRESNCKQHMEKAHGWNYIRSKNNGRQSKKDSSVQHSPQSPSIATPASKSIDVLTPATGPTPSPYQTSQAYEPSPYQASQAYAQDPPFSFADPPTQNPIGDFPLYAENNSYGNPSNGAQDVVAPNFMEFDAFQSHLEASDPNRLDTGVEMHRVSFDSSPIPDLVDPTVGFDVSPVTSTDNTSINFDLDWGRLDGPNFNEEFTSMNMQVLTPEQPDPMNFMNAYFHDPFISESPPVPVQQAKVPGFSPGAHSSCSLPTFVGPYDVTTWI